MPSIRGTSSQHVKVEDVRELRQNLALSDEDRLNWKDFVAATMDQSVAMREDNMKMAFEHFKHTDADYLTLSDLADIFEGETQAKEIMVLLDSDGDGKVSFEDFRHAMAESMEEDSSDD